MRHIGSLRGMTVNHRMKEFKSTPSAKLTLDQFLDHNHENNYKKLGCYRNQLSNDQLLLSAALRKKPALPKWAPPSNLKKMTGMKWNKVSVKFAEKRLLKLQQSQPRESKLQDTFGMVKCVDDNIGKLLAYLKTSGLEEDTIVVFTSDHGDSMGEHLRHNKLTPYDTSAGVPFVIRYPAKIAPGKVVRSA